MSKQQNQGLGVQLIAGAFAAIAAAVVGSTLGIAGTVLGAGVASILTTLGVALYQRVHTRAPRWTALAAGGILAFAIGMLLVTGLEWARGSQLSGGHGTTIGGIVSPNPGSRSDNLPTEVERSEPASAPTVTTSPGPSSTTVETTPTPPPTSGVATSPPITSSPQATTTTTPEPTPSALG